MLYDSYHAKISKIVVFLRKIFRHIVLISIVLGLLLAALVAFMITKGMVIDDSSVADNFEITYGDSLPMDANAIFSKVSYEYSSDGATWSNELPLRPGEYFVRATAKSIFGQAKYGNVYTFKVVPKEVEVFVEDEQILYGEIPTASAELSYNDKLVCEGFVYADRFAKNTEIAPDLNTVKIFSEDDVDVTDSYVIKVKSTNIDVEPRPILVTVSDQEMVYNDTVFSYDGYELHEGTLAEGDVLQATFDKYLVDVGSIENTPQLRVVTSDGFDISMHYIILTEIGMLTVDYRPIIIQTSNAEKVYDDTALTSESFEIIGEYDIVEGHIAECVSSTSITNVDECENILVVKIKNAEGDNKTPNYSLFYETGMLKVTPRPLNVTSLDATWVYDGIYHSGEFVADGLVSGHTATISGSTIIDVGEKENAGLVEEIIDANSNDVMANYEIIYGEKGTLSVTKRPITIRYESSTEGNVYDGTEKIFDKYEIDHNTPTAAGDGFKFTFPTFKFAGEYIDANKPEVKITAWRDVQNENGQTVKELKEFKFDDNYEVTEILGTIIIDKCEITLQPVDNRKEYDGNPLEPQDYKITQGDLPAEHLLDVKFKPLNAIDAGEYYSEIDLDNTFVFLENGEDVTANFAITTEKGTITIDPISITLRANSDNKRYDGTPLVNSGYTVEGSLLEGHTVSATVNGSQIEIGWSENVIDKTSVVILDSNGNVVNLNNYTITYYSGTLTVRGIYLSVTANSDSKQYDGEPLFGSDVTVDELSEDNEGLLEGHRIEYTLSGSRTNVGTADNVIETIDVFDAEGNLVTGYYEIIRNNGVLKVTPICITVNTEDFEKTYDGTPLEPYFDIESIREYVLEKDIINVSFSLGESITNAGSIENSVIITVVDPNAKKDDPEYEGYEDNYSFNYNYGTLTVNPIKIIIETGSAEKFYDGTPLIYNEYFSSNILDVILPKDTFNAYWFSELTNADKVPNLMFFEIIDPEASEKEKDMFAMGNYVIDMENSNIGTLMVKQRSILIRPKPDVLSKVYDGIPLTCYDYDVIPQDIENDGFINGERIMDIEFSSVTNATHDSPHKIFIADVTVSGNGADNYKFIVEDTYLEITPRKIYVVSGDAEKLYDGIPLIHHVFEVLLPSDEYYDLVDGHWISGDNIYGEITNVGEAPNIFDPNAFKIYDESEQDVTDNYIIIASEGILKVLPNKINIELDVLKKTYDGNPLSYSNPDFYKIVLSDWEFPEEYSVEVDVTFTNPNVHTLTVGDMNLNIREYILVRVYNAQNEIVGIYYPTIVGKDDDVIAEIKPKNITFEAASEERCFVEGEVLSNQTAIISLGSLIQGHSYEAVVSGEIDQIGSVENELHKVTIYDEFGNDVSKNYNIRLKNGTLEYYPPEEK